MAVEDITLIRVDTGEAVRSIADLKANIKAYKETLETLDVGTREYADTLVALQSNQAALKNAMHDTSYEADGQADSFAQTARAAQGLGTSYNALVRKMADLDQQFRSTEDAAKRAALGEQIKAINEQLKEMDAARGKFGRNVGDYFNQMSQAGKEIVRDLPSGLGRIKKGLDDTTKSLGLMSKQPILGIVALLAPLINNIVSALKENETALGAVEKVMNALKPVADFFAGVLEKIAGWLAQAVDWLIEMGNRAGVDFKKIVAGAVGVGNAVKEFLLVPIRNTIAGIKGLGSAMQNVFKGNFRQAAQDAKNTIKEIGDSFKKGFSFKENFEIGRQVGEEFAAGLKSTRKKAGAAAKAIADEVKSELASASDIEKLLAEADRKADERRKERLEMQKETDEMLAEMNQEVADKVTAIWDEYERNEEERRKREEELQAARVKAAFGYASALANVLGSIADIYEQNGDADEAAAKKAKELRTASAIISTISGAISAYMNTIESIKIPQIAIPLAIANAATVLAAGMAQVKQINAVKVGDSGGTSASVTAPSFATPAVQQVRNVTGASEEERLNRMASDNRVYIVYSDIEEAQRSQRVKVSETEF